MQRRICRATHSAFRKLCHRWRIISEALYCIKMKLDLEECILIIEVSGKVLPGLHRISIAYNLHTIFKSYLLQSAIFKLLQIQPPPRICWWYHRWNLCWRVIQSHCKISKSVPVWQTSHQHCSINMKANSDWLDAVPRPYIVYYEDVSEAWDS